MEAGRAGGVAVDGVDDVHVLERGACFEDEGEGVLVGRTMGVAEHGGVEGGRAEDMGGAVPGVGSDEGVVGMRVRVGIQSNRWRAGVRSPQTMWC